MRTIARSLVRLVRLADSDADAVHPCACVRMPSSTQQRSSNIRTKVGETKGDAASYDFGFEVLGEGSTGPEVEDLQRYLQEQGFFTSKYGATGYFGPATKQAVIRWQVRAFPFSRGDFAPRDDAMGGVRFFGTCPSSPSDARATMATTTTTTLAWTSTTMMCTRIGGSWRRTITATRVFLPPWTNAGSISRRSPCVNSFKARSSRSSNRATCAAGSTATHPSTPPGGSATTTPRGLRRTAASCASTFPPALRPRHAHVAAALARGAHRRVVLVRVHHEHGVRRLARHLPPRPAGQGLGRRVPLVLASLGEKPASYRVGMAGARRW